MKARYLRSWRFLRIFECSPVRRCLRVSAWRCFLTILRFAPNSATLGNPFFADEITFPTVTRVLRHSFRISNRGASASRGGVERNDRDVGRAAFGGRPLHPGKAKRGSVEKIPSDLSGAARLQPSLFYPTRRRCAQCEIWK